MTIAIAQVFTVNPTIVGANGTFQYPGAMTPGSSCFVAIRNIAATAFTVSDPANGSWSARSAVVNDGAQGHHFQSFTIDNVVGGTQTITVNGVPNPSSMTVFCYEITGSAGFDNHTENEVTGFSGTVPGATWSLPSVSPSVAPGMIVGMFNVTVLGAGITISGPTGMSNDLTTSTTLMGHQRYTGVGAITPAMVFAGAATSSTAVGFFALFKEAGTSTQQPMPYTRTQFFVQDVAIQ